jgi:hypothetical protein
MKAGIYIFWQLFKKQLSEYIDQSRKTNLNRSNGFQKKILTRGLKKKIPPLSKSISSTQNNSLKVCIT